MSGPAFDTEIAVSRTRRSLAARERDIGVPSGVTKLHHRERRPNDIDVPGGRQPLDQLRGRHSGNDVIEVFRQLLIARVA